MSTKRPHDLPANSHSSNKKPRFDARNPSTLAQAPSDDEDEEDLILNADVIGSRGAQTKRKAVRIEGYESDSGDEREFDLRAAERAREKEDMFAEDAGEAEEEEAVPKKKDVRFLDARSEVEGQVMGSKSGGRVSGQLLQGKKGKAQQQEEDDGESSSGDEEDRDMLPDEMENELAAEIGAGGKKKHAPRLDAFNLRDEEEEGKYDQDGNFVRRAVDPDAANDGWLDGLTRKDLRRAKEAEEAREEERRRREGERDAVLTEDLLGRLIGGLETGETVLEALQRLGKGRKPEAKVPKWKAKKMLKKSGMEVDEEVGANGHGAGVDAAETKRKEAVEALTASADALYSRGQHEIYDTEREVLMRQYRREAGEDWKASIAPVVEDTDEQQMWEYRWSDARDGGETHGPYDGMTMKAWNEAGYFGDEVEFRQAGDGREREWSRVLPVA